MTNQELIDYYSDLLIIQYNDKPKAVATVQAYGYEVISNQVAAQVRDAFALDTAIGVQLDILGKYIGITRQGVNVSGSVTLNDDDYRDVLYMQNFLNVSDGTLASIQEFLMEFFPAIIIVFDYLSMRMSYYVDSNGIGVELAEFFVLQNLLPVQMGVLLSSTIYYTDLDKFFGFRTYENVAVNNSPYNDYDDYQMDRPWLQYEDALI